MWGKKKQNLEEVESQKQFKKEDTNFLRKKSIKELIAPDGIDVRDIKFKNNF